MQDFVERLEELLGFLARSLVENPDEVEVSSEEDGSRINLELRVADEDMGKVIGRGGRTVKAMRTVVKAASVPMEKRVNVEVVD